MTRRAAQASFAERWPCGAASACASLLILYVSAAAGCGTSRDSIQPAADAAGSVVETADSARAAARPLEPGAAVVFDIRGGETRAFSLDLDEGRRVRLVIEKGDLGL